MASAEIQTLLRFLSHDAKLPLASAMGKVMDLQKANLISVEQLSKAELKSLQEIFKDDKVAKQVLNAAKRASKKRQAPTGNSDSPQKKARGAARIDETPYETESALSLPISSASEDELSRIILLTNRAPLVLAFAVCVLKYTMPEQPISSRLSLAQAVVSANSRSKAISLGIESGKTAEQEGWGEGHPVIKVLGREIKVLKRWDYNPQEGKPTEEPSSEQDAGNAAAASADILGKGDSDGSDTSPPLWGVDLEALRSAQGSGPSPATKGSTSLPIFTPSSAKSYLYRSFTEAATETTETDNGSSKTKRKSVKQLEAEKETCLGYLLQAIDLVCQSWASTLSKEELDRRAWAWASEIVGYLGAPKKSLNSLPGASCTIAKESMPLRSASAARAALASRFFCAQLLTHAPLSQRQQELPSQLWERRAPAVPNPMKVYLPDKQVLEHGQPLPPKPGAPQRPE
ncbi:hypothetical protein IFM58399_07700 [Aspergillus lentulus]|uniref:DNA replication factor Cdt1 C-terminal domain-containing protein n=1 Tax=Aspergillus lentulus TaxID=293939 RepID=A0ABQ1ATD7_ASPLE|nr:uncharacterized protein IFM58399_07700 [Aspergillus lentulus]KAF4158234.1 hypothetical protein CNMCM6069_004434 [Aspergillus lentulus]KAF4158836.1 hypothetical protein CNMCM6936_004748 [Aspergillus lentulus]KAF4174322.1 hypothetical protein CNMCM8060_008811 [Aspergillus lentulus]KAF4182839.1 hypothetical protein CNMCM7927_009465 [Aspergillus lentulus]KAF4192713.1 hypothetical protein CNMCM8694_000047 [Aspergillus lentulus]